MVDKNIAFGEVKRLLSGEWGKGIEQIAINCTAPFFWVENPGSSIQQIHNGSIFFLNTGRKCFAVSAYHVYEGYLESLARSQNISCQISTEKFDPKANLLDYSKDLDLITFNIEESLLSKIRKSFFTGHQSEWPPQPPEIEKGLVFAGYPGICRDFEEPFTIKWGIFRGICVANHIGNETISIHFDPQNAIDRSDQIPQGFNSAGISGAPLITLVESENGINYWRLGGVIYEAQPSWDIILARRANFILSDGKIRANGL